MKTGAKFSKDRKYRYALWRIWNNSLPKAMFVGLNPSTADEIVNDPTVRRCIGFALSWGYGGLLMANIFAFRATDPKEMQRAKDPVGLKNNLWLRKLSQEAAIVICAWGDGGGFMDRGEKVMGMLDNIHCLKMNKSGVPTHPLYQPKSAKPIKLI